MVVITTISVVFVFFFLLWIFFPDECWLVSFPSATSSHVCPQRKTWQHQEQERKALSQGDAGMQRDYHVNQLTALWMLGPRPAEWHQHGARGMRHKSPCSPEMSRRALDAVGTSGADQQRAARPCAAAENTESAERRPGGALHPAGSRLPEQHVQHVARRQLCCLPTRLESLWNHCATPQRRASQGAPLAIFSSKHEGWQAKIFSGHLALPC